MKAKPGTYVLVMHCRSYAKVQVGKLGIANLLPGTYAYVGSAFGPGGVRARVQRHLRGGARPHWHIDYVLPQMIVTDVWYTHDPKKREEQWARGLANAPGASIPLQGFGASDCGCEAHLFYFGKEVAFNPAWLRCPKAGETTIALGHLKSR